MQERSSTLQGLCERVEGKKSDLLLLPTQSAEAIGVYYVFDSVVINLAELQKTKISKPCSYLMHNKLPSALHDFPPVLKKNECRERFLVTSYFRSETMRTL